MVLLQTVDGDVMIRNEMFDEAALDTALARFDELNRVATAGKRGESSLRAILVYQRGPRLGRDAGCWPTTLPPTIAVHS